MTLYNLHDVLICPASYTNWLSGTVSDESKLKSEAMQRQRVSMCRTFRQRQMKSLVWLGLRIFCYRPAGTALRWRNHPSATGQPRYAKRGFGALASACAWVSGTRRTSEEQFVQSSL